MTSNQDSSLDSNQEHGGSDQGTRKSRGFAAMPPEKQRAIASQGGRAAHASGNAHQFTPEEASAAGRKGGAASHTNRSQAKLGSSANSTRGMEHPGQHDDK